MAEALSMDGCYAGIPAGLFIDVQEYREWKKNIRC